MAKIYAISDIHGYLDEFINALSKVDLCTAPQKLDIKNLTFGVFFNEINL